MPKKNQIILTPKSRREFYFMTFIVVYAEPLLRILLKKHKKLSLSQFSQFFVDDVKNINKEI